MVIGNPADNQAVRVVLNACMPTWLMQPPTNWSTSPGSMPERSTTARWATASRSAACMVDNPPPRFPLGVRTASMITTSLMGQT